LPIKGLIVATNAVFGQEQLVICFAVTVVFKDQPAKSSPREMSCLFQQLVCGVHLATPQKLLASAPDLHTHVISAHAHEPVTAQ